MRWRARLFPVGCVVLLALLIGAGCPALQWERARREQGLVSSGFSHHRVRAGDAEVDYWVGGEGPPVVLIHGFGASALWQWPGLARALARVGA